MEKTPNYQLSQWAKTDRILMEDFNADNARLEAALTALNTALGQKAAASALNSAKSALQTEDARLDSVKLERITLMDQTFPGSNTTTLKIPIDGLALGQMSMVDMRLEHTGYGALYLNPNSASFGTFWNVASGASEKAGVIQFGGETAYAVLFPMRNPDSFFSLIQVSEDFGIGRAYVRYRDLTCFWVRSDYKEITGDIKVRITGIK